MRLFQIYLVHGKKVNVLLCANLYSVEITLPLNKLTQKRLPTVII